MSSALLAVLTAWCRARGLPDPEDEYPFHPTRKWRWDYAFPTLSPDDAVVRCNAAQTLASMGDSVMMIESSGDAGMHMAWAESLVRHANESADTNIAAAAK